MRRTTRCRRWRRGQLARLLCLLLAIVLAGCGKGPAAGGEEATPTPAQEVFTGLDFSVEQIRWVEISPAMSLTTYVDRGEIIEEIYALFGALALEPISAGEAADLLEQELDPDMLSVEGTTYPRNVRMEFVSRPLAEVEQLASAHLYGSLVAINDEYYTVQGSLVDELLVILDRIHQEGWGKSASEVSS